VKLWLESTEDDEGLTDGIADGAVVRVLGHIKTFNNKRHVAAQIVRALKKEEYNQWNAHYLSVIWIKKSILSGLPKTSHGVGTVNDPNHTTSHVAGTSTISANQRTDYYAAPTNANPNEWASLDPTQKKIMVYVTAEAAKDTLPPEGLNVVDLVRLLQGGDRIGVDKLRTAVEGLVTEGNLYTTTDDDHFLPT